MHRHRDAADCCHWLTPPKTNPKKKHLNSFFIHSYHLSDRTIYQISIHIDKHPITYRLVSTPRHRFSTSHPFPSTSNINLHSNIISLPIPIPISFPPKAITVANATDAYNLSVKNGAIGVLPPTTLTDKETGETCVISEISSVGDVVIRWIDSSYSGGASVSRWLYFVFDSNSSKLLTFTFIGLHSLQRILISDVSRFIQMLPNYKAVPLPAEGSHSYGLVRADHVVSNVPRWATHSCLWLISLCLLRSRSACDALALR
jgi:hypothetical protein